MYFSSHSKLNLINQQLHNLHEQARGNGQLIFLVGPPRSGTTLLEQLLINAFQIAYIDDVAAKLWESPISGVVLSNELHSFKTRTVDYNSKFGFTDAVFGPHEYGWFWRSTFGNQGVYRATNEALLNYNETQLQSQLFAAAAAVELPLLFKNPVALTLHLKEIVTAFPNAIYIRIKREPLYVAQSLLLSREKIFGSVSEWFSTFPPQCEAIKNAPATEEVAAQVYYCEELLNEALKHASNCVELNYEQVVERPSEELAALGSTLKNKYQLELLPKNNTLKPLQSTNKQVLDDSTFSELKGYVNQYFQS